MSDAATTLDINELPRWDLTDFYDSSDAKELQHDIETLEDMVRHLGYLEGKIATIDGDKLAIAIKKYEEIEELAGKIGSFAFLTYVTDMPSYGDFFQNISETLNRISSDTLFFTLEINDISDGKLAELQLASRDLQHYAPWLRDIRSFKPYQLNQELEKLLHEKSISSRNAWSRLFDETMADLRFDFKGEELTCAEVMHKLSSHDADERKLAAKSVGNTLNNNINIFCYITNILAKDKSIDDAWRKFESPISSRNVNNLIEDDVVDALITTVKKNYSATAHRYYAYKAKLFGKDALDYWDRNAPLPMESDEHILWDEAVEIVLDAYKSFSPKLADLGASFFANSWIDVPPAAGKDSGAFAHPTVPSVHPYLMLNYQGKIRDVMTLAHELGHGVHQLLAAKQGALMADTPLTLAETASVFGEQLVFRALLNRETDPQKRKIILANKIEDMLNTVVRQIAFCEFETLVHDARKHGELSADALGDIWMSVQQDSLGDAIIFHEEYRNYWSYIPHFIHSPFYVYAYAFGDCLVNSLYARYKDGMENFEEHYFTMLEAGGTLHHKDLLAPFNLDASNPDFWQKGLDIIIELMDELEAID